MKKTKRRRQIAKYIYASFIGKVSMRRKEYIKDRTVGIGKNIPNRIYPHFYIR